MKAIMISIRPQWVAKILNGEKTIEIRKKFPSNYVGWVYIYVTKALPHLAKTYANDYEIYDETQWDKDWIDMNGKVVASFWCDKVEEINIYGEVITHFSTESIKEDDLLNSSCLSYGETFDYFDNCENGKAIHITELEIFDKPKEIKDFSVCSHKVDGIGYNGEEKTFRILKPLARAPQSWCYIEV